MYKQWLLLNVVIFLCKITVSVYGLQYIVKFLYAFFFLYVLPSTVNKYVCIGLYTIYITVRGQAQCRPSDNPLAPPLSPSNALIPVTPLTEFFLCLCQKQRTPISPNRTPSRIISTPRVTYASMDCGRRRRHAHRRLLINFYLVLLGYYFACVRAELAYCVFPFFCQTTTFETLTYKLYLWCVDTSPETTGHVFSIVCQDDGIKVKGHGSKIQSTIIWACAQLHLPLCANVFQILTDTIRICVLCNCDCVKDATQTAVLRLQHDPAVSTHHARCPTRLLHPQRLRWEGDDGHHNSAVDDRLSDVGCREHAGHVRRSAACRYVRSQLIVF